MKPVGVENFTVLEELRQRPEAVYRNSRDTLCSPAKLDTSGP